MNTTLPVTILGGYLGAGKTTLVNHLLRHADGRRLAILVNEFGALPIDEDLIEATEDNLISIAGGCICCSFGSDLSAALSDISTRRPDHILIEASGVAMPAAIAASIGLLDNLKLTGIFVLADAATIEKQLADEYIGDTVLRQLVDADVVVLSKTDLINDMKLQAATALIEKLSQHAVVLSASHGKLPTDLLLGYRTTASKKSASLHTDDEYMSYVYSAPADCGISRETISLIAQTAATGGYGVVRCKGFLNDTHNNSWLVQTVGQNVDISPFDRLSQPQLVFIGVKEQLRLSPLLSAIDKLFDQAAAG